MQMYSFKTRCRGKTIGFVPTMGCLHEGHLSLVEAAKKKADVVVVSIFVNPIQFGPSEDYKEYPRPLATDKGLLEHFDIDVLFLPEANKITPDNFSSYIEVDKLSKKMCGRARPAYFRGVTTIVAKFFNIVCPDFTFFGEKDYQQQIIIKKMVKDLGFAIKIITLPTVREFDGLAMSSRNQYLSVKEREQAIILYKALCLARQEIESGEKNDHKILLRVRSLIGSVPNIRLDYVVFADPETLDEVKTLRGKILVALAAYIGKARLIDNLIVNAK